MSRRLWTILIAGLVVMVLLGAAGAGGALLFLRYRTQQLFDRAERAYANGLWEGAKNNYAWYLMKRPDDMAALNKYAEASLHLLNNRRVALRDTGKAYFEMAKRRPDDLDAAMRVMAFYEKHRFWDDLEYCAEYFLRAHPDNPALRYRRALALHRLGRVQDAVEAYRELIDSGADTGDTYGNLAQVLRDQGLSEQAKATLDEARGRYPDDARIYLQRARYFLAAYDLIQAEQELDAAFAREAETAEGFLVATEVALAKNDWATAASFAEKTVALAPDSADAYLGLVYAYERQGEFNKAMALLEQVDPVVLADNPELFLALAEMQISGNRLDEFRKTVETYRSAYPEHFLVFEYLAARELLAEGRAAEAAAKFTTVVESNPDFVRAQFYRALAYLQANETSLAQGALESYLRNRPDDARARALWESAFGKPQSPQDIEAAARALLADERAPATSLVLAARSLVGEGQPSNASDEAAALVNQLLERAIQLAPTLPDAYRALAEFLVSRRDGDGAARVLERADRAGIPKEVLVMTRASIALSKDALDQARACLLEDLGRAGISRAEVVRWAEFFASRGHLDTGLEALSTAAEREANDTRAELELDKVSLCTRFGDTKQALMLVKALEPQLGNDIAVNGRLNEEKSGLAEALLRTRQAEDAEAARQLIDEVERDSPDNIHAQLLRAELFLRQTPPDYSGAEAIAAATLETHPSEATALLIRSDVAARKGRFAEALEYAELAVAAAPRRIQAQIVLARSQLRMRQYAEARRTLETVLAASPDEPVAMELLVRACGAMGQFRQAQEALDRMEKASAGNPEQAGMIESLRGWLSVYQGNWSEAETLLRAQHKAAPEDFAILQDLAKAVAGQGRGDEAEQLLRGFTEQQPDNPEAWTALGRFYLTQGNRSDLMGASSAFTRALLAMGDYAPALRGLIEVELRANNPGGALGLCNRYLAAQPDDADVLYQKAVLLRQDPNRLGETLETIQHAIEITERPEFFSLRGSLYLRLNEYRKAVEDLQRFASTQAVTSADLDASIAEAHLGLNEPDLARRYYESAKSKPANGDQALLERLRRIAKTLEKESAAS